MNPARQFWTLFKFQLSANPFIWIYVFALATPLLFISSGIQYLDSLTRSQNLFFVGFLGVMLLAPEIMQSNSTQWPAFGSEFLLTRAVDRIQFTRARGALFYSLVLLMPVVIFLVSLKTPDLEVITFSQEEKQECVAFIPGSVVLKNTHGLDRIQIPGGKVRLAVWHLWSFLMTAAVVQLVIVVIEPFRFRKYIFWGLLMCSPLLPLLVLFSHETFFSSEKFFFLFTRHALLFGIETIFFVILCQLWCERRFAQQEI
jgi:hypothetical protein